MCEERVKLNDLSVECRVRDLYILKPVCLPSASLVSEFETCVHLLWGLCELVWNLYVLIQNSNWPFDIMENGVKDIFRDTPVRYLGMIIICNLGKNYTEIYEYNFETCKLYWKYFAAKTLLIWRISYDYEINR